MAAKTDWKDYVPDSKGVRYQLVSNGDGTYNIVDATTYEVVGDKVTAAVSYTHLTLPTIDDV